LLPAEIFWSLKADGLLVSISSVVRIIQKFKINGFARGESSEKPIHVVITCDVPTDGN